MREAYRFHTADVYSQVMNLSGQLLREARLRAGLTQRTIAARAGVSQPTVARIERGDLIPSLERLVGLIRACGFDLDIRVTDLDEDAWTQVERGAAATPDERLDRLLDGLALRGPNEEVAADG
jgi:transcriptional regulator with XRE-family HTH domain